MGGVSQRTRTRVARDVLEYLGVPADLVQARCRGDIGEIQGDTRELLRDIGEI